MTAELHLVTRCDDCGGTGRSDNNPPSSETCVYCDGDGGSVEVLDPETVVLDAEWAHAVTVRNVLDALTDGRPR